jgi:sarcosine oxidase subunit beta
MKPSSQVIICGAGIAGISSAYFLANKYGIEEILLIDPRPPLSLTSDKSTECYRNWWPGPGDAMVQLMNRSIDLLEKLAAESDNRFQLNRRGYLYLTADAGRVEKFYQFAAEPSQLGAGPLRVHTGSSDDPRYQPSIADGYVGQPDGADLLLHPELIREHYSYLDESVLAALHVRRAGWFSAQQLGMYLLEEARSLGVQLVPGEVTGVEVRDGRVRAVELADGTRLATEYFINAAGPYLNPVGQLLGISLPVFNELHLKVAFTDHLRVVPREAPLLIWTDPIHLPWSVDERSFLKQEQELNWLLEEMPPGAHARPEGSSTSPIVLMLWDYKEARVAPVWPPPLDDQYPDIVLRGLARMLPGLRAYFDRAPRPRLDGGYYTKTRENRPLIGPLPVQGAYVIGALSGYGLMASCAAGELMADHLSGEGLPDYAPAFSLERYADLGYQALLKTWANLGQL